MEIYNIKQQSSSLKIKENPNKNLYSIEKFIASKINLIDSLISNPNFKKIFTDVLKDIDQLSIKEKHSYITFRGFKEKTDVAISNIINKIKNKTISAEEILNTVRPKHSLMQLAVDKINKTHNSCCKEEKNVINDKFNNYSYEREKAIESNIPLALHIYKQHYPTTETKKHIDNVKDDAISNAFFYLVKAVDCITQSKNSHSTFLSSYIAQQCISARKNAFFFRYDISNHFKEKSKLYKKALNDFTNGNSRAPSDEEKIKICQMVGIKKPKSFLDLYQILEITKKPIDKLNSDILDEESNYHEQLAHESKFLNKALAILQPSQRDILQCILNSEDGKLTVKAGKAFGISKQRVNQIWSDATKRLKKLIIARDKNLIPLRQNEIREKIEEFLKDKPHNTLYHLLSYHFGLFGNTPHPEQDCNNIFKSTKYDKLLLTKANLASCEIKFDEFSKQRGWEINGEDFTSLSLRISYPELFKDMEEY